MYTCVRVVNIIHTFTLRQYRLLSRFDFRLFVSVFSVMCSRFGSSFIWKLCVEHTFQYAAIVVSKRFVTYEHKIKIKLDFECVVSFSMTDCQTLTFATVSGASIHIYKWAYQICIVYSVHCALIRIKLLWILLSCKQMGNCFVCFFYNFCQVLEFIFCSQEFYRT